MFIKCMTKEEWEKASTEDLINLVKLQLNNVACIIWDQDIREVRAIEARLFLARAALCKLGFPKGAVYGKGADIDSSAKHCINEIAEYEKTSFTIDPKIQTRAKLKLTAPIGDLRPGDEVNLL